MFLRSLFAVVILAFASGTVALADPPTVSIRQQATLLEPMVLEVIVAVTCGDGESNFGVAVTVRQNNFEGEGEFVNMSTGDREEVPVLVIGGPFKPGEASASAVLVCGTLHVTGLELGTIIKISEERSQSTLP